MVHRSAMSAFRPGAVWSGVSECARGESGRRVGKVLLGAALLGIGLKVYGRYRRYQRRQRWNQAGKDVVVLHQFERATNFPNLSPFALKLETFLRMAGIKYVVDTEEPQGSRNKCPWITFNGQELSDSELIIDFLTQHFGKPLKEKLTPAEHAVGRAVQVMLDEHTIMAVAYKRYVLDGWSYIMGRFPKKYRLMLRLMMPINFPKIKHLFYTVGIGRFSEEETMFFLRRELRALEDVLGDKPFLLDSTPTTYDAAAFAELTQVIYGCAPEVERYVRANYDALVQYHERMKDKYWPDWEQCRAE
ncbi:failed axon connections homolog [Pollicipes pollicipes]|uniref:failed axon connections homolog n=1 Tax=Pollicipes pollicipes TaxID=41117 RepID=UPI001884E089|nr:failed axon connections homolog [Pollicipes pollicipes]